MAWVRVDDQVPRHPKFLRAGPAAAWLWICGLAYCQSLMTDGEILDEALPFIGLPKGYKALATVLVKVGLWERTSVGYQVHDYLIHNETRDEAIARKTTNCEQRRRAGLASAKKRSVQREANEPVEREGNGKIERKFNPDPTRPDPTVLPKEPEVHTESYVRDGASLTTPLHRQHGDHRNHVSEFCFRQTGVCFPSQLLADFRRKSNILNEQEADAFVRAFVERVNQEWKPNGPVGDDDFAFWRARWQEAHGTTKTAVAVTRDRMAGLREGSRRFLDGD